MAEQTPLTESAAPIALIAGLGNPGTEHAADRHNAGFWLVDELARRCHGVLKNESRFHGEVARLAIDGRDCWVIKPATFMNRSGQAVAALAGFYKIPPEQILVVHDELDLAPGTARLKFGGGHGGHNGLRDLGARLGTMYQRLRIGIGHPGHKDMVTDYVLGRPPKAERVLIEDAIAAALDVLPLLLAGDTGRAMNLLHSRA